MMQKLTKLKSCIESNPKREYDIVKEFLLNNKLFEIDNFQTNKLKNFVHFIKGDFLLDPAKNFKENIMDILNGNEIEKPQLSYKLKNKKKAYFRNELLKQNIKNLEINSQTNSREDNDNCIVKNLNRYPQKIIEEPKDDSKAISPKKQEKHIKNKTDNEYNMSPIYSKPKSKGEIIERLLTKKYHEVEKFHYSPNLTEKEKEIVKNFKRLPLNLRRQKEIYSSCFENLDLDNNPKIIIDLVEKKFKDEEKENEDLRAKTVANWNKVIKIKNEKLYGEKIPDVMILSARDADEDIINGLGFGADEFITKPFSPGVLVARVKANLRRQLSAEVRAEENIQFADFTLLLNSCVLKKGNSKIPLSTKEYEVLEFLVKHAGQVVSPEFIYKSVWKVEFGDITAVAVYIQRLRKKLETEDSSLEFIKTEFGKGYIFNKELLKA